MLMKSMLLFSRSLALSLHLHLFNVDEKKSTLFFVVVFIWATQVQSNRLPHTTNRLAFLEQQGARRDLHWQLLIQSR